MKNLSALLAAAVVVGFASLAASETLRWASVGDIVTFDPHAHTETHTRNLQEHVYEGLVRRSNELEIEPALATSWEIVAPDRWRFQLREGVRFHNGNTLDAADVVASIERMIHPDSRARANLAHVVAVEKVDDMTVDIVMPGPYPLLLNDLTGAFILDRQWLEENDALEPGNIATGVTTFASRNANGTGPFKLESYRPDAETVLVVNDDWWDEPQHNLTRIEMRPIVSDSTRIAALLSGEVDLIVPAPLQDLDRIENTAGFTVLETPSVRLIFFGLNFRDELHAMPGEPNPIKDRLVRQAMWHAIDLEAIQERIMRGKSRNVGTLVAPPVPGYSEELDAPLAYDPEKASELLREAGYENGFRTNLNCPNDRYLNDEQICLAIASMWAQVSIEADVGTEGRATYFPRLDNGEFDVWMLGYATLPAMDGFAAVRAILATRDEGFGGWNPNGLSDARIDEIAEKAGVELDEDVRRALLTEAFKIAKDEAYVIPLHQQPVAWGIREGVDVPQFEDENLRFWFASIE